MNIKREMTVKKIVDKMGTKKKVLMGAVGILALTGLGVGAANASTPPVSTPHSVSVTADTPTQGDTPDGSGTNADTPTQGDTPDGSGTNADTPTQGDTPDGTGTNADTPDGTGTNADTQQSGNYTDATDLPGSP
ncbi:hypothetical protein IV498_17265 [Paenarthrobacter sp. Z7-10]|uniref:hypothetical protein n=1 Tax=Paenarthrobacter sp. Z7-10 TaxID=2787635 RepID=UPI0022A9B988|nr:hypothetical protein [Paenarthrobacter sp. Z7-10]MCZ2404872.1 hypothetical protein [Paenarthrobacter sp. Z7-10]